MGLSAQEREEIITAIRAGRSLTARYRASLFDDALETELIWPGKTSEVERAVLPFQSTTPHQIYIIETKGLQDLDVAPKWKRLVQWCADATNFDPLDRTFTPLFVSEEDFNDIETKAKTMQRLAELTSGRHPVVAEY